MKRGIFSFWLLRVVCLVTCSQVINSYTQCQKSYRVVSPDNLKLLSQELAMRKCKAIGGIHWDEIYIKKGIKVCARNNQLVGYEDLEIPENILEVINMDEKEPQKTNGYQIFQSSDCEDSSTDEVST